MTALLHVGSNGMDLFHALLTHAEVHEEPIEIVGIDWHVVWQMRHGPGTYTWQLRSEDLGRATLDHLESVLTAMDTAKV